MSNDRDRIGFAAMQSMDDSEGAVKGVVIIVVSEKDGDGDNVNYRFQNRDGTGMDMFSGVNVLALVLHAITQPPQQGSA